MATVETGGDRTPWGVDEHRDGATGLFSIEQQELWHDLCGQFIVDRSADQYAAGLEQAIGQLVGPGH